MASRYFIYRPGEPEQGIGRRMGCDIGTLQMQGMLVLRSSSACCHALLRCKPCLPPLNKSHRRTVQSVPAWVLFCNLSERGFIQRDSLLLALVRHSDLALTWLSLSYVLVDHQFLLLLENSVLRDAPCARMVTLAEGRSEERKNS